MSRLRWKIGRLGLNSCPDLREVKAEVQSLRDLITQNQEFLMAALDDLKAAIADLTTELASNNAEIDTLLTKITATGTSDADVQAAVTQIRSLISDNSAEVAKAKTAAGG